MEWKKNIYMHTKFTSGQTIWWGRLPSPTPCGTSTKLPNILSFIERGLRFYFQPIKFVVQFPVSIWSLSCGNRAWTCIWPFSKCTAFLITFHIYMYIHLWNLNDFLFGGGMEVYICEFFNAWVNEIGVISRDRKSEHQENCHRSWQKKKKIIFVFFFKQIIFVLKKIYN